MGLLSPKRTCRRRLLHDFQSEHARGENRGEKVFELSVYYSVTVMKLKVFMCECGTVE